jgi:hypothetical protein
MNKLQASAFWNHSSWACFFNLKDTRPEMLTQNAFGVSRTIALCWKATCFWDLREIKGNFVIAARALNFNGTFFFVPDRIRNSTRIKISSSPTQGDSRELPNAPIF